MHRLAPPVPPVRALRALPSGPSAASTLVVIFESACAILGLLTLGGIVVAARGRVFREGPAAPASVYREGARPPVVRETPSDVRLVGAISVGVGVLTAFLLAPAGILGALIAVDGSPSLFLRFAGAALGLCVVSGLVLGIAMALMGVRLSQGRELERIDGLATAWTVHHALVASYFFLVGLDQLGDSARDATWLYCGIAALVVAGLGWAHARALRRAGATMRAIVAETGDADG